MIRSVIIAGSRTVFPSVEEIDAAIAKLDPSGILWVPDEWHEVVCGMASGADLAGKAWAEARGKDVHPEPITTEDIRVHGKYKGPRMRNRRMAERADAALILWDGVSGGSADLCARMNARDKQCKVIPWAPRKRERPQVRDPFPELAQMIADGLSYIAIADRLKLASPKYAARVVAEFKARQHG